MIEKVLITHSEDIRPIGSFDNEAVKLLPKEYALAWTLRARRSLRQIIDYIAADKPIAAENFRSEILRRVEILRQSSILSRIVSEFEMRNLRELFRGNDRIIYGLWPKLRMKQIVLIFQGKRRLLHIPWR